MEAFFLKINLGLGFLGELTNKNIYFTQTLAWNPHATKVTKGKQFCVFCNFVVKYKMSQFTHFLRQFLLTKILLQGNFGLYATLTDSSENSD